MKEFWATVATMFSEPDGTLEDSVRRANGEFFAAIGCGGVSVLVIGTLVIASALVK